MSEYINTSKEKYKYFTIIAFGWLGDSILNQDLCANIKKYNPDSIITFVCPKNIADVPSLIQAVDNIIIFDKKNLHKGIKGYFKFAQDYKKQAKTEIAIITHPHERSVLCAKIIGAKHIISLPLRNCNPLNLFIDKKRKYYEQEIRNTYKGKYNSDYLKLIGINPIYSQINLDLPSNEQFSFDDFNLPKKYIVLSPESKDLIKDWDYKNILGFINNCFFPVVLTGTEKTNSLAEKLTNDNAKFINLCGKTSIMDLAKIIKHSQGVVTVDTGTMHLSCGLGIQTVCLFYNELMTKEWLDDKACNVHLILGNRKFNNKIIETKKEIEYKDVLNKLEEVISKNAKI